MWIGIAERVLASVALVLITPVVAGAAIAIRIETPGAALFSQRRVGRGEKVFTCYKLRTMRTSVGDMPTHQVDPAVITRVGAILRRTKLDELPQLWNIARGDMRLVGPRPCLEGQIELIEARRQENVFSVSPGVTGLAQLRGIDMSDPALLAAVDGDYVRSRTMRGDIAIAVRTVICLTRTYLDRAFWRQVVDGIKAPPATARPQ